MNDRETDSTRSRVLLAIVTALVVVVGIQAWHMADMRDQIEAIRAQTAPQPAAGDEPVQPAQNTGAGPDERVLPPSLQSDAPRPDVRGEQPQQPAQRRSPLDDDGFNPPHGTRNWDPFLEMERMQRQMDEIFNNAFGRFHSSPDFGHLFRERTLTPDIDLQETEDEYIVKVDVPGTDENNLSVTLENQVLTITGEQRYEEKSRGPGGSTLYHERRSGTYRRSITLPEPVSDRGMRTQIEHGVLTIRIPKAV